MKKASEYAEAILRDDTSRIVSETPREYGDEYLKRVYEFDDGAVVEYEWQSTPDGRTSPDGKFNHRFTLVTPPAKNPQNFAAGEIYVINYPVR